jgi:hypothetical protein
MARTATTTTTTKKTTTPKTTTPKTPKTTTAKSSKTATVQVSEVRPSVQTQTQNQTQKSKAHVNWEQKQEMIRVSAFLRAQKRGFQNGNEMNDWLEAEREINQLIGN